MKNEARNKNNKKATQQKNTRNKTYFSQNSSPT